MWQGGKLKDSWRDKKASLACKILQRISNKINYEASWESTLSTLDGDAQFYKNLMNTATGCVPMAIKLIWKRERNNFKDVYKNMLYWKLMKAAFKFISEKDPIFPWFICIQAN